MKAKNVTVSIGGKRIKTFSVGRESIAPTDSSDGWPLVFDGTFVPIDGTQKQIPNTGLDERTYDFMQGYLSGHGFTDAANELKNVKKFFEFYSE